MQRRRFLAWFAAAGALWPGGPGRTWTGLVRGRAPRTADRLAAVFSRPASAAAVGRAYLAAHPGEAGVDRLAGELETVLRRSGCEPAHADLATLRVATAQQIKEDFAQSRVVQVEGWVLSLSEARLCGLAALLAA
jgi:hypothetical protein